MAKFRGAVVVDTECCKGCNLCVVACPQNVLKLSPDANSKSYHFSFMADPEKCIGCGMCAQVCPDSVITVYKVKI